MMVTTKHLIRSLAGFMITASLGAQATTVDWSSANHRHHYADINGDGIQDLLLQAKTLDDVSSLTFGNSAGQYPIANQRGLTTDFTSAQIALGDFNGDGLADLFAIYPTDSVAIVYAGTATGIASTGITYAVADLPWLPDAIDMTYVTGDFNGDGRDDVLAVGAEKSSHYVMHADVTGKLSVTQTMNGNIKWGKKRAEKLLVRDFNNDGRVGT